MSLELRLDPVPDIFFDLIDGAAGVDHGGLRCPPCGCGEGGVEVTPYCDLVARRVGFPTGESRRQDLGWTGKA